MEYTFDEIVDRTHTNSVKWDYLEKNFKFIKEGVLPLWVADMDFACAKPIQEALHQRIDKQIYGYTISDEAAYYESVISWFQRRFHWSIQADDILYSPGVVPAIAFAIRCLSKEGDGIIIQEPVYYPFARNIKENNRVVVNNPLINKNGVYTIDYQDLEEKMRQEHTAGMIFCSPHNPVGRVWTADELKKVGEIALKYGKWIICDEIHCDLIRKGKHHIPMALAMPELIDQLIICTAPSKSFNLAGIQNSNIIIHNEEYKKLWREETRNKLSLSSPNVFAHVATIAAYNESEDWLHQVNQYIDENISYAEAYLKEYLPKAIVSPCEGTYLIWIDFRNYISDENILEEYIQHKANVLLDEGYLFGESGKGFERINVACPRSILKSALERITAVLLDTI